MTKKRPERTERRARERAARQLVRDRRGEPGGAPDRPIVVPASPVVDVRARALRCPLCGGAYRLDDHTASTEGGVALRIAHVTCQTCGVRRQIWFRISSPLPS